MTVRATDDTLIWIVDDSRTGAAYTASALGPHYRYETFENGRLVVERLKANVRFPDVILLDWVMPEMTGDEVCRVLRADPRTHAIPVVMLTASRVETQDVVLAIEAGANDYVAKPFVPEELSARVGAILRENHLKRLAAQESARIKTINAVGRALFEAGPNVEAILRALATSLVGRLCDGCAITLLPGSVVCLSVAQHEIPRGAELLGEIAHIADPVVSAFRSSDDALANLPQKYHPYIRTFGLSGIAIMALSARGLAQGIVTFTRDAGSDPFDPRDLAAIETCLDHTGLALEVAIRSESERATMRFHEEMIGIVGHDLRTPLQAMAMGIALLGEPGAEINPTTLKRLDNSTKRMTKIVDQLLDLTRARLGQGIPLNLKQMAIRPLVASVLDEIKVGHADTIFELVGDDVSGMWDGDRLSQVFSNLASNAIQYGLPNAPIRVAIDSGADEATITIRNAIRDRPIPETQLATLFDPFKRADTSRSRKAGLGLGLYIVGEIVRAHHGTIDVASNADGTVFRVTLPIRPPSVMTPTG